MVSIETPAGGVSGKIKGGGGGMGLLDPKGFWGWVGARWLMTDGFLPWEDEGGSCGDGKRDKVMGNSRKEALGLQGLGQEFNRIPMPKCHSGWLRAMELNHLGFGFGSAVAA